MKPVLFDTNVIIQVFNDDEADRLLFQKYLAAECVCISVITVAEIQASPFTAHHEQLSLLLPLVSVLPVTKTIALEAGLLKRKTNKKTKAYLADCLIAATAKHERIEIITHNTKDFALFN